MNIEWDSANVAVLRLFNVDDSPSVFMRFTFVEAILMAGKGVGEIETQEVNWSAEMRKHRNYREARAVEIIEGYLEGYLEPRCMGRRPLTISNFGFRDDVVRLEVSNQEPYTVELGGLQHDAGRTKLCAAMCDIHCDFAISRNIERSAERRAAAVDRLGGNFYTNGTTYVSES